MRNWQIKTRIFTAFIFTVILIAIVSLISVRSGRVVNRTLSIIKDNNLEVTLAFMEFGKAVDQIEITLFRASASRNKNDKTYIDRVNDLFNTGNDKLKFIEDKIVSLNIENDEEILKILEVLSADFKDFKERGLIMAQAYNRSGPSVGNMFMKQAEKGNTEFSENIIIAIDNNLALLENSFVNIKRESDNAMKISIGTVVLAIIFVIIVGLLISNSISVPIIKLMECTKTMAQGDITERIEVSQVGKDRSKNEVYRLSLNFNKFADALCIILDRISQLSQNNKVVKDSLLNNTEMSVTAVTQISANVKSIRNLVDKLDHSISQSSEATVNIKRSTSTFNDSFVKQVEMEEDSNTAITQMAASIKSVASITSDKKELVEKLNVTAVEGKNRLFNTISAINEIAESVEKINDMVALIGEISSQTNLLSMNAAIEAAHAGDVGKGFAVVADEIGKLADSSKSSLDSISLTIKHVISSINNAVSSGKETEDAFKKINSGISDVTLALGEISSSTDELNIGSSMILDSIGKLQQISSIVKDESLEMVDNSETVTNSIESVQEISSMVTTSIGEIEVGIRDISKSMTDIEGLSDKLGNTINELNEEVGKFTTPD